MAGANDWAKYEVGQEMQPKLCGVNPVTNTSGMANVPSGQAGQLRPGVGGRGHFEAGRENNGVRYKHSGIDIAGTAGVTSVSASLGGQVIAAYYSDRGGNTVKVSVGGGYTMAYMHLESYSVSVGDILVAGHSLGVMGQSGNALGQPATEAHVHFEIRNGNGQAVDPVRWLNSPCPSGVAP